MSKPWHVQRVSQSTSQIIMIATPLVAVTFQAWLGWRRITESDPRYLFWFLLFSVTFVALIKAMGTIAAGASRAATLAGFKSRREWFGVLCFGSIALFYCFADYTQRSLSFISTIGNLFIGVILAAWSAANLKVPKHLD